MLCRDPFIQGMHAYPCGRCMPCLRQRRRQWTHRILLERQLHSDAAFVTLTYAEDLEAPPVSLEPKHLQNWMKRLRASIAPTKVRFYAVGEYGEKTNRPHYHVALFGYPSCQCYMHNMGQPTRRWRECHLCKRLRETWGWGHVYNAELSLASAQYIAGYVLKKMTMRQDPRLKGRHPEFARMSNRPGIGHDFMFEVASQLMNFNLELTEGDVPVTLRHGKKLLPLGRYLRRKLRTMIGREEGAPNAVIAEQEKEMRDLYISKLSDPSFVSIKSALVEIDDGTVASQNARAKIMEGKKSL